MGGRDMQGCDSSVGRSCNVKLVAVDFVVRQHHLQTLQQAAGKIQGVTTAGAPQAETTAPEAETISPEAETV